MREKRGRGRPKSNEKQLAKMESNETRYLYAAKLFGKGFSRNSVSEQLQEKYGIAQSTAASYIREAYRIIAEKNDSFIKNLRHIQLARLELLWEMSLEKGEIRVANEIIKTINQLFGLSQPENQVNIQNNYEIKFDD